jgi:hypothetical protein
VSDGRDALLRRLVDEVKAVVRSTPGLRRLAKRLYVRHASTRFRGSEDYWVDRYAAGGNAGFGSQKELADFKAAFLRDFVADGAVASCIEYGCGDGDQLDRIAFPDSVASYLGFDVSPDAIDRCRDRFAGDATKRFALTGEYANEIAELTLSIDVLYHLVEDAVFDAYMGRLFTSASRFVIIYSSNTEEQDAVQAPHVRHRAFENWIATHAEDWRLLRRVVNPVSRPSDVRAETWADFYVYERA